AAMHVLAALGGQANPLSDLVKEYVRYVDSGEVNSQVADPPAKLEEIKETYSKVTGVTLDFLDGVTIDFPDRSWANVRPSYTEPLLRPNVEAPTAQRMVALRDELLTLIRR